MNIKVKIDVRDADSESLKSQKAWPGMVVVGITDQIRKNLNLPKKGGNIVVGSVEQNSPAAIGGIRPGDIIKEINGKSIDTVMDFYKALSDNKSEVMIRIVRQNNEFVLGLVK
ncbi:MAG TPA: PDZ domain-containing protein [Spirochaetia bacterium]|nr:PDZ domain-containing protein [Spirochaetia bacterium]